MYMLFFFLKFMVVEGRGKHEKWVASTIILWTKIIKQADKSEFVCIHCIYKKKNVFLKKRSLLCLNKINYCFIIFFIMCIYQKEKKKLYNPKKLPFFEITKINFYCVHSEHNRGVGYFARSAAPHVVWSNTVVVVNSYSCCYENLYGCQLFLVNLTHAILARNSRDAQKYG